MVLAVDDSRSMREGGNGVFAMEAVTLLARALARLEVRAPAAGLLNGLRVVRWREGFMWAESSVRRAPMALDRKPVRRSFCVQDRACRVCLDLFCECVCDRTAVRSCLHEHAPQVGPS